MLSTHMNSREQTLLTLSRVPANSGHPLHKGTPREAFIREFLVSHLPENVAIGSGEIIDFSSKPGEIRNQYDIVIYKRNYPKLDFGGGISGFLIESVIATVEVKSTLTEKELRKAIRAARNAKMLVPSVITSFTAGYIPPSILNYVVAYSGPSNMETVYEWILKIHNEMGITIGDLPVDGDKRLEVAAPTVDAIFVLGKGMVFFDNIPISLATDEARRVMPDLKWVFVNAESGNLLMFFVILQIATANIEGKWLNASPYIKDVEIDGINYGKT